MVKSLEEELRKSLRIYNYSFACAEGLEDLEKDREKLLNNLAELKRKLGDIDYKPNLEKIQKHFNDSITHRFDLIADI